MKPNVQSSSLCLNCGESKRESSPRNVCSQCSFYGCGSALIDQAFETRTLGAQLVSFFGVVIRSLSEVCQDRIERCLYFLLFVSNYFPMILTVEAPLSLQQEASKHVDLISGVLPVPFPSYGSSEGHLQEEPNVQLEPLATKTSKQSKERRAFLFWSCLIFVFLLGPFLALFGQKELSKLIFEKVQFLFLAIIGILVAAYILFLNYYTLTNWMKRRREFHLFTHVSIFLVLGAGLVAVFLAYIQTNSWWSAFLILCIVLTAFSPAAIFFEADESSPTLERKVIFSESQLTISNEPSTILYHSNYGPVVVNIPAHAKSSC